MLLRMFVKMSEMSYYHLESYTPQLSISIARMLYDVFLKSWGVRCGFLRLVFRVSDVPISTCTWADLW
jgi:hypothetical protein